MSLRRAAIELARRGWAVFPLEPRGKRPLPGTSGHKDATTRVSVVKRWWREIPDANIGVACSSESGPLVIDVDGPEGLDSLKLLKLPSTLEATSGREGRKHLYFSGSSERLRRAIKVLPGIDLLGDGGYVVAPPSIHPKTQKPYRWLNDRSPVELNGASLKRLRRSSPTSAPPLPNIIYEGERDGLLTSLAGSMRRRGASERAILAALREENSRRCQPPLDDASLRRIAKSIGSKEPASSIENLTDLGNARRFVRRYADAVRYVAPWRQPWLIWDDHRWAPDETGEIARFGKTVIRELYKEALNEPDADKGEKIAKHAHGCETAGRLNSMLELASTEPEIASVADVFDADPWALNVENGVVDLRTGERRAHRREELMTKLAPVAHKASAKAPLWRAFLRDITDGDGDLERYLQRAVGYSLTGVTTEHCLFFCFGSGRNGKSTFLETIREMLGDYSQQADFSTFLQRRGEGPRNDIARMRGMRFITAVEASGARSFDEEILKQLTGGDRITARRLYEESFEFVPTHKLFLAANHKPRIDQQTEAMWDRIRLIPFTTYVPPERRDKDLKIKLAAELPGILNWAIEGCLEWQQHGLVEPEAVIKATRSYREEEDLVGEFIEAACVLSPAGWTRTSDLFQAFTNWWRETRGLVARPPSPQWFGRSVAERSELKSTKKHGVRGWRGISVKLKLGR